jgi:cation diffusion facilitator family transporter
MVFRSMHGSMSARMESTLRVLWTVLALNLALALMKYFYGVASHSASMQADGIHSIFDSIANLIAIVGIHMAAKPADEGHPYGHAKYETYASVGIGLMLVFAAYNVATSAIASLMNQTYDAEVTPLSFLVMIGTLTVNISVTRYERRKGEQLNSEILRADSSHTLSDALVSSGVIVGLILVRLGFEAADPVMALVVSVAILYSAWEVFKEASTTLSDHARIPEEDLHKLVMGIPGVISAHRIRTRGIESEVYADMHIHVDPDMTVADAHALDHRIEAEVQKAYPQVVEVLVHIEPANERDMRL